MQMSHNIIKDELNISCFTSEVLISLLSECQSSLSDSGVELYGAGEPETTDPLPAGGAGHQRTVPADHQTTGPTKTSFYQHKPAFRSVWQTKAETVKANVML